MQGKKETGPMIRARSNTHLWRTGGYPDWWKHSLPWIVARVARKRRKLLVADVLLQHGAELNELLGGEGALGDDAETGR